MNYKELHKAGESQLLEFKTSFGKETMETVAASGNKLLAEAFYLRGDIEKFGTGFFRIQTELKDSPEVSLKLESLSGFTRSRLEVISQDTPQDTPQDDLAGIPTVKNLLKILTGEMTRQKIQTELKLQDKDYLRKSYLQPALKKELIEMTLPDKPNSKYQKYRLTEKGKKLKEELITDKKDLNTKTRRR